MRRSEKYRQYAAACLELASGCDSPEARGILLQMAQVWFRLASKLDLSSAAEDESDQLER